MPTMRGHVYTRVSANPGPPEQDSRTHKSLPPIPRTQRGVFHSVLPFHIITDSGQWSIIRDRCLEYKNAHFSGRPFALRLSVVLVSGVFAVNIIFMLFSIIFSRTQGYAVGTLISGSCATVKSADTGLHLLINILSTVILFGSSVFMQILGSPTRRDIDKAHARRRQLDVGVTSLRNLFGIGRRRAILWVILALTALPVHLLYVLFSRIHMFIKSLIVLNKV
jgi:hypothetical protein